MTAEIWPGSRLSLDGGMVTEAVGNSPDPFVLVFLLAVSVSVVLLYQRLVTAVAGGLSFVRGSYATQETLGNMYVCNSVELVFFLMVPLYAVALRIAGLGGGYLWVFGALCAYLLFRRAALAVFGWLSDRKAVVRALDRVGSGIFVLVALLSFVPVPVLVLFPSVILEPYRIYLAIIALIGYILYAVRSLTLISSTGFSSFFWVLYLCTLEILPVCVVVNYLLNGN